MPRAVYPFAPFLLSASAASGVPLRTILAKRKCRERDSNPHNHSWSRDFKSLVSTIPPSRQHLS